LTHIGRLRNISEAHIFHPHQRGNRIAEPWPEGQPWIFFESWGGFYSSESALNALLEVIQKKQNHYGNPAARSVRLLIYYCRAVRYNTPYYGIGLRGFGDVARFAANALTETQISFENIYLFEAVEPDLQVFEIHPNLLKCN
jgi:hypothetical protein